ncbi:MAG: Transport permease protein [Chlamydiia bacterium]|nr:Transport permease protein [Chlamydiia bacterium]
MFNKSDAPFPVWTRFTRSLQQISALVEADIRKLCHDPSELLTRMTQPIIWLLIFGQAMAGTKMIQTGELSYLDYIAPGILAQSILFIAIFHGISLIWEKDMGILQKIMVTPAPRVILVLSRALSAAIRALSQIVVVYLLSFLLGIHLRFDVGALLGVVFFAVLAAGIFSTYSLIVASIVKKRERFMGIGQVLTMPIFFASNALYPITMMPSWIRIVSLFNPLTYLIDGLRSLMIQGGTSHFGLSVDFIVAVSIFSVLVAIATRLYPKILY